MVISITEADGGPILSSFTRIPRQKALFELIFEFLVENCMCFSLKCEFLGFSIRNFKTQYLSEHCIFALIFLPSVEVAEEGHLTDGNFNCVSCCKVIVVESRRFPFLKARKRHFSPQLQ